MVSTANWCYYTSYRGNHIVFSITIPFSISAMLGLKQVLNSKRLKGYKAILALFMSIGMRICIDKLIIGSHGILFKWDRYSLCIAF